MAYINGKKILTKVINNGGGGGIDGVSESNNALLINKDFTDIEIYGNQQITLYNGETKQDVYNSVGDLLVSVEDDQVTAENLEPQNIVKDVTILGVTGTFEGGSSEDLIEALCNDTLINYSSSNVTKVKDNLFKGSTKLKSIDLPNATSIGNNSFSQCTSLENANLPNATSIGSYAFSDDTKLKTVNIPNATSIGSYAFQQCYDLKNINPINVTTISTQAFASCNGLESIELFKLTKIDNYGFRWCYALKKVVIEQTDSVCVFGNNVFDACCHIEGTTNTAWGVTHNPNKLKDGYIYVPASLLSQYKVATNLTTYETQIIGHQDFNVGDTLPSYANDTYTTCTWYSDETLTTVVTSVATQGRYYCRLEA